MSTAVLSPARRPRPTHTQSSRRSGSVAGSATSSSIAERVPEFQRCAKLPRKLPKLANPPSEVDYSIIEHHAPDICKSGTPLSYVRDALAIRGPLCVSISFFVPMEWPHETRDAYLWKSPKLYRLYDSASIGAQLYTTSDIQPPIAYISPTKRVPLYIPPTHVLVASSLGTSSTPQPSKFIPPQFQPVHRRINHAPAMPIHAIVLTSQCTRLPHFKSNYNPQPMSTPPSLPFTPSASGGDAAAWTPPQTVYALPIIDLKVPSPSTFLALLEFLYRQDIPLLLGTLLPNMSNIKCSFSRAGSPDVNPNLPTVTILKPKSDPSPPISEEALKPEGEDTEMKLEDEAPEITTRSSVLSPAEVSVISTVVESREELSTRLAEYFKQSTFIEHLHLVYGVWKNALCLGVINDVRSVKLECRREAASDGDFNTEDQGAVEWRTIPMGRNQNLWTTLELAWEILIGALDRRIDMDKGIMEERQRERVRQAAQKAALDKAQRRCSKLTLIIERPDDEDEQKYSSQLMDGDSTKPGAVMVEGSWAKARRGREDAASVPGYYSSDGESEDGMGEVDPSVDGSSQAPSNISHSTASSAFADWPYRF